MTDRLDGAERWDRATLEAVRAEMEAGYFGPDRAAVLARIDELMARLS